MEKFDFFIGSWNLEYRIPHSQFHEEATGSGTGVFKRVLNNNYLFFDYSAIVNNRHFQAHGVFTRDDHIKAFRYWWFEDSGNFSAATCNFINDNTLAMNWHDTLLVQTFEKINPDKIILKMKNPDSDGKYQLILEVIFTRK